MGFETKDSGKRIEHESGMVRDTTEGKIDYLLALDGPMFQRYAELMHRGQTKYGKRNWMKARTQEEYDRAKESLTRHFFQYIFGMTDEDHAAAVMFNINEMENIKLVLAKTSEPHTEPHTSRDFFLQRCIPRWVRGEACEHGEFEVGKKCTYPGCEEPAKVEIEEYMHKGNGIVWETHPHYKAR